MISREDAYSLAQAFVEAYVQPGVAEELVITGVEEHSRYWVASYNTKAYVETGKTRFALVGNGPLIIDRESGALRPGVSGEPIEDQLGS
jgi:hypothetical protein